MIFNAFSAQAGFLGSTARIRGAFAGKRGGKTEAGAISTILALQDKPNYLKDSKEPYRAAIVAPTFDMLRRLSMDKFLIYAKPLIKSFNKSRQEVTMLDGSVVYGLSADRPERLEGLKLNFIWLDEAMQMEEQVFMECLARLSDSRGMLIVTSSLGLQYLTPKSSWCYKHFYEKPIEGAECFEWATADNPHFPQEELNRLAGNLDNKTYRQMFHVDWDVVADNVVYDEFDDGNVYQSDIPLKDYEICCSIDWGWTNPTAVLFFAYSQSDDRVYLFDEIVESKLTLEQIWDKIKAKRYVINQWFGDISGAMQRGWFRQPPRSINIRCRPTEIHYGIRIVRSYIKNHKGERKFFVHSRCKSSLEELRNYSYEERRGDLTENPKKKSDHCCDSIRYFFVNRCDKNLLEPQFNAMNRWGTWQ